MMNSTYHNVWSFGPAAFLGLGVLGIGLTLLGIAVAFAVIALKGYSLTFGILELIYLYFIVGKWHNVKLGGSNSTSQDSTYPTTTTDSAPKI